MVLDCRASIKSMARKDKERGLESSRAGVVNILNNYIDQFCIHKQAPYWAQPYYMDSCFHRKDRWESVISRGAESLRMTGK
jgi:hypothetical protein